ncbi:MAG: small basic protein [Planctomycetota bacterium]
MGIHKSLVTSGRLARHRNVLKRDERIARLQEEEKWKEEVNSVFGLQKVRNILQRTKKVKKAVAEGEAGVEGEAAPAAGTAPGAKPAAGAAVKGAAPAKGGAAPAAKPAAGAAAKGAAPAAKPAAKK